MADPVMRIGLVTKWFNSGQAVFSRQLRSAFEELGHETFVLARRGKARRSEVVDASSDPIWDQPGVSVVAGSDVSIDEYAEWIERERIDVVHVDNLYGFAELAELRRRGTRVIGRFVWEHFGAEHADPARDSLDLVYSVTRAEQRRYAEMGIEAPYVQWGCHPELIAAGEIPAGIGDGLVRLLFPGGTLARRKPWKEVIEAFSGVRDDRLRLLVRGQLDTRREELAKAVRADPRIEVTLGDQPTSDHLEVSRSCDVCLSPSRWEGLGIPLFEAIAFGQPIITNDDPPMNEVVEHELNGLLVGSRPTGTTRSGVEAFSPDVGELRAAIERVADRGERARLHEGALEMRERRSWERTVADFGELLERLG